jgi:REP element-mobilizing transposase RayT
LHGSLPKAGSAAVEIGKHKSAGEAFATIDRELDRAVDGPRWPLDERVAQCVVDTLRIRERELGLYQLRAWVLMMNHVHILIYPRAKLSRITKAVKNFSARQGNALLGRTGQPFWQDESYDHWVRSQAELEKIVRYIEENPVAAGLVERAENWRWSSAFRMPE